jgi:alanine-synthesizing transaminase
MGLRSARDAVAADFARRGLTVPPEHIALTASTSEAYAWLFKLLCDPGDVVLIPQPSYPLFEHLTTLESVSARPYRLDFHSGWRIDLDSLVSGIDERTRAVLVVSPNNPTGSFLHQEDLQRLDEVCAARNLMLIGDEVFADFPLAEVPNARSVMDARAATVCSLGGLSKTVGLPQIKLGWIGFGGPSSKLEELMPAYELVADTFLSVSTPAQIALPHLLARGAGVRRQIQTRIARNLQHLQEAVRATPAVSLLPVEGGWSATLQVPSYRSEEALVIELLTADHVLVHPGYFFDFERESFVIISLLVEPSAFDRGVARLLTRATEPGAR